MNNELNWESLVELEPRLAELLGMIEADNKNCKGLPYRANYRWYVNPNYKAQMQRLVGWYAQGSDPDLYSNLAYDIAYKKLFGAIQDCDGICSECERYEPLKVTKNHQITFTCEFVD